MAKKQQIVKYLLYAILVVVLTKCANQMSPPGGEIDKIPPTIISTYPENGSTNFTESTIEFNFSEYVNKRNINTAFFVSPLLEGIPEFSWTNKTVYIEFPEKLKKNTTYSVIIGTEVADVNNNNNMTEPFILTFSTGSKIDSGKISGKVYADHSDGTLIFAYKIDSKAIDIYNNKPDYLSQINDKGLYEFTGLGMGTYKVYAVKDEFKDLVYNIGDDMIGIPTQNVELNDVKKKVGGINFFLEKEDTLSPNVQTVTMTDKNHIVVEFNEAIDSSKLTVNNFSIYDSTSNKKFIPKYWFRTNSKKHEYILCLNDSLSIEDELFLQSMNISDKLNNTLDLDIKSFTASDKPDTNLVKLGKILTPFKNSTIDYLDTSFIINFSDAFDYSKIKKDAIKILTPDSTLVPFTTIKNNDAQIEVKVSKKLKQKTQYKIIFSMKYFVDIAGNKKDTLIAKRLTTVSDLDFSGASGKVTNATGKVNVVIHNINSDVSDVQTEVDKNSEFMFDRVIPGKYLVWAYIDSDSNNLYSHGKVNLSKFAEYFQYYPDTLNLRPRWPVGDINIDLNNN